MRVQHWFYTIPLRLRSIFRRRQVERDLDEELQYHLDNKIEELLARGLDPAEARNAALRAMDGLAQRMEECRDARRVQLVDNLLQDIRYGARMLRKTPTFTCVAICTLALGIGACAAIFSVVDAVLLKPLPYPDPDRIVQLMLFSPGWAAGQSANTASVPEYMVWREQMQVFENVAAYDNGVTSINFTGSALPEQLKAIHVSQEYFQTFGVPLGNGRAFLPEEDRPGGRPVVILTAGFWRRRLGGDPSVVGRTLLLAGEPHTVVGIVNASFVSDPPADVWLPLRADTNSHNPAHVLRVAARLHPGVTLDLARSQMRIAYRQFREKFPESSRGSRNTQESFTAEILAEALVGGVRYPLLVLLGAVSFVLLIVCANVANLLLARATIRRREMAIRAVLGAGRQRILAQLLVEGLLLSLGGCVVGLPLGYLGVRALVAMNGGGDIPRIDPQGTGVSLDLRLAAFALLVSAGTTVLFSILPALSLARADAGASLGETGARQGVSRRQKNIRSALVVSEVALALVLLTGASLLIRTLRALASVNPGFDADHVLTMDMSLNDSRFRHVADVQRLVSNAERRVRNVGGVTAFAASYSLPLENPFGGPFTVDSRPDDTYSSGLMFVSERYFEVFRIPLLQGRLFTELDTSAAPQVALIDEALAHGASGKYHWRSALTWPNGNPLGRVITMGKNLGPPFEDRPREVVGVVGQVRDAGLSREPQPLMYVPIGQLSDERSAVNPAKMRLVWSFRASAEPLQWLPAVERELRAASGGLPVAHVREMKQILAASTARNRFQMVLLTIFAGIALILSAVGVYGVMAFAVQHRTHEIGIRIALGARAGDVRRMLLLEGFALAITGIGIGLIGVLALAPSLDSLLYGVKPSDPAVLTVAAVLLAAAALAAAYIPARWATRVDPMRALRWE
jgi:putative ABC transport system permease protein